jgi:hypothetical protein
MAARRYRLFGLTLETPLALPCPIVTRRGEPDVMLTRASETRFARALHDFPLPASTTWFLSRRLTDDTTYLQWRNLYEFIVSADGRQIWYHRFAGGTPESFSTQLLGQVLSFSLLAFGREPLHATVVARGSRAVALCGDCGDGKSTLAASLLGRGCRLVTDDVMVTEPHGNGWVVHPGVPRIKLFPAVARKLLGEVHGTPMNGLTSKLVVPLARRQAVASPIALHSIYVLPAAGSRGRTTDRPWSEPLSGREAFLEIVRAAFNLQVLGRHRQAVQFAFASRLAREVPLRRLAYKRSFATLPAVADLVLAELNLEPRT